MSAKLGKTLRVAAIVLMGFAAAFTLLGAAGTICLAWNADKFGPSVAAYIPNMPMYQLFVYIKVVVGIAGGFVTYGLIRGRRWAYPGALAALAAGLAIAAVQMYYSSIIKDVSFFQVKPTNMRFYVTLLTLVFFLVLKLPGIRDKVDFSAPWRGGPRAMAGGLTAFVAGVLTLTVHIWAGPSHMMGSVNLVNEWAVPLAVTGWLLTLGGLSLLSLAAAGVTQRQAALIFRRRAGVAWQAAFSRVR